MKSFPRFDTRRRLFVLLPILFLVNSVLLIGALYNFSSHSTVIDFIHNYNGPRTLLCHNVMTSPETVARLETLGVNPNKPPIRESAPLGTPRARVISAGELMSRYTATLVQTGVSKIIHQSWKADTVPDLLQYFVDSWRVVYPEYEYVLWTDDDNRDLVKSRYPELLSTYDGLPSAITRADFMRNLYMHAFGGIYADLDSEPLARLHDIESTQVPTAYLGAMDTVTPWAINHSIPNAWMASAPGHPFWLWPVTEAQRVMAMSELPSEMNSPEYITGPSALRNMYYAYQASDSPFPPSGKTRRQANDKLPPIDPYVTDATANGRPQVILLPAPLIYPYSWDTSDHVARCACSAETVFFDTEICKRVTPGGYVTSYWSHSWGGWKFGKKVMEYTPWGKPKAPQPYVTEPPVPLSQ
ncbi:nucleotide-diphospho-sugar transferase [Schizophyllum amplum]|uniref:Nucleotide-diphospho-sugar transferase n=1 Tax=Schizophyllum amplum TaxID=97359 RepID=A0A550CJK6_9AGAR|nr:nucleotide-diphospho-sugar transferase [Auriculariopsis ampla]